MNGDQYTVKELLTLFVIPRLENIESNLNDKASTASVEKLELRVQKNEGRIDSLERSALTENSERKGRHIVYAAVVAVIVSLLLPIGNIVVGVFT